MNNIETMIKYEEYDKCVISPDKKQKNLYEKKTMCVDGIFYIEKKQNHVISVTDDHDDFSFGNTLIIDDLLDNKKSPFGSRRTFTVERNEDTDGNVCKRLLTKYKKIFCIKKNFLRMVGFIFQWSVGCFIFFILTLYMGKLGVASVNVNGILTGVAGFSGGFLTIIFIDKIRMKVGI